jgi:hypothetical protein
LACEELSCCRAGQRCGPAACGRKSRVRARFGRHDPVHRGIASPDCRFFGAGSCGQHGCANGRRAHALACRTGQQSPCGRAFGRKPSGRAARAVTVTASATRIKDTAKAETSGLQPSLRARPRQPHRQTKSRTGDDREEMTNKRVSTRPPSLANGSSLPPRVPTLLSGRIRR